MLTRHDQMRNKRAKALLAFVLDNLRFEISDTAGSLRLDSNSPHPRGHSGVTPELNSPPEEGIRFLAPAHPDLALLRSEFLKRTLTSSAVPMGASHSTSSIFLRPKSCRLDSWWQSMHIRRMSCDWWSRITSAKFAQEKEWVV